jgi:drug/metabolite transporter (DMT)-like permease
MIEAIMEKKSILQNTFMLVVTALFCNLLWGTAIPAIKIGYQLFQIPSSDTASQILFAGIRFTLAGLLTLCIGSLSAKKLLLPNKKNISKIFMVSLFQTVLQYFFFYGGLAHASGVKSSIIESSLVFFTIILSAIFLHNEKNTAKKLLCCLPGFLGVLLINLNGQTLTLDFQWNGEGFILFSTIAASMATVLIKKYSADESPVLICGWQFFFGGLLMAAVGYCMGGTLSPVNSTAYLLLFYLGFLSAAAYSLWGLLLKYHPVSKVSVFSFTNPIFGILSSAVFLQEDPTALGWHLYAALLLVCVGIYLVNKD